MNHSFRILLERLFFVVLCFGVPIFSIASHATELQRERVQMLCEEMLSAISAKGELTRDDYERFLTELSESAEGVQVELLHTVYQKVPVYEYATEEKIINYYAARNQRETLNIDTKLILPEKIDMQYAKLQEKSNASVLGGGVDTYVPLPKEEGMSQDIRYVAMEPIQEVYIGEELITVCMVETPEGYDQIVADPISLPEEGVWRVYFTVNGVSIPAYAEVTVYPREQTCSYGHRYACTKEDVKYKKETGIWPVCPICQVTVTGLSFVPDTVTTTVGTELQEVDFSVIAVYQDGHTELLQPTEENLKFDYDRFYCGIQEVEVSYAGFLSEGLTVVVIGGTCRECGSECKEMGYMDYMKRPFCSRCLTTIPMFLGNVDVQKQLFRTEDVISALETGNVYKLKRGDTFSVRVTFMRQKYLIPVWVSEQILTEEE